MIPHLSAAHIHERMAAFLVFAFSPPLLAEPTEIFGPGGKLWEAAGGPLPDFSYAGYQRGEKPLPQRSPDVSVKDFGAVGDGVADDTAALQRAIDENPGKTISLPEGRYLISDILTIRRSGTVLQGAGPEKTILHFPVPLQEIHPKPVQYQDTGGTSYAYSGGFISLVGSTGYFANEAHAVTAPAARGDIVVRVDPGHAFTAGDEVVILAKDTSGQSLLRHLYRDDPGDIANAGNDRSFRHVTRLKSVEGPTLILERPLRIELRPEWQPEVRAFQPRLEEVGIEHLSFEFPVTPYLGHFTEKGFNAIHINGAAHSWVRDVAIRNADSGIFLGGSVFCTLTGIVIESERRASNPLDATGHHGISMTSLDCLCTGFEFRAQFIHELTLSGGSVGSVFSNGRGPDMALDHHKLAPYENLFSNIDLGKGERIFKSGGSASIGRHAGAGNTYWNLASKSSVEVPEGFAPARMNLVGLKMRGSGKPDAEGRWIESITPGKVEPPDLHEAQLALRLGSANATELPAAVVQEWTNSEGRTLRARFAGLDGQEVLLVLETGQSVRYSLSKLSPESQTLARKLAAE